MKQKQKLYFVKRTVVRLTTKYDERLRQRYVIVDFLSTSVLADHELEDGGSGYVIVENTFSVLDSLYSLVYAYNFVVYVVTGL